MRALYPESAGSVSNARRTPRFCQKKAGRATINTFRPLTRTSSERTRSPRASRASRSIFRLTDASVTGSRLEPSLFRSVDPGLVAWSRRDLVEGVGKNRLRKLGNRGTAGRDPRAAFRESFGGLDEVFPSAR
jgi:hypothetical protein